MRSRSPHHADVFSHLPVQLMAELDTPEVAGLLDALVAAGWEPARLRHRVGPTAGGAPQTAAGLVARLRALSLAAAPDAEPRTRPACSLCDGEGAFPVTDGVQLCRRCVGILSSGRARLSDTA